jgi:hypothetical protein
MIHIDRRHPEIGGAANPIRQAQYSANILNHENKNSVHNTMAGKLLRQYEEDRREERERLHSRELIEAYETILKFNEIENRKRMGVASGLGTMNEIFSLVVAGIITPGVTIDREGIMRIRFEGRNKENDVKALAANQNGLTVRQFQNTLAILVAQSEFNCNFIEYMEKRKRNLDVKDEELAQMFAGGVEMSHENNSEAEQLRIEDKPKVVSRLLSRVKEKKDDRSSRQEVKMSRTEPEPLGMLFEDDVKKRSRLDQYSNRLPRSQEHFTSIQDHRAQQDRIFDEMTKEDQQFIEEQVKMHIRAIQEKKSKEKEKMIYEQSFYVAPGTRC